MTQAPTDTQTDQTVISLALTAAAHILTSLHSMRHCVRSHFCRQALLPSWEVKYTHTQQNIRQNIPNIAFFFNMFVGHLAVTLIKQNTVEKCTNRSSNSKIIISLNKSTMHLKWSSHNVFKTVQISNCWNSFNNNTTSTIPIPQTNSNHHHHHHRHCLWLVTAQ